MKEDIRQTAIMEPPGKRPFLTRNVIRGLFAIVMLGGGAAVSGGVWPAKTRLPPALPAPVPVVVGSVSNRDMPIRLSGVGTVTSLNAVDVKVRVDGQLQSVAFTEGQMVAPGTVLAQIDPRPYQAALAQAEANRQKDLAQLANAQQEVERTRRLASAGAGTSQSFDAMKAQAAALRASVAADEAAVDAARLNLDFTRIVSPIAGRTGLRQADPGSIVHASDLKGIVTVTQMAPISVLFSLPQDDLDAVISAQRQGDVPVAVFTRDGTRHIADGRLVFVDSSVMQTNGQFQVKAVFDNAEQALWPGAFVSARMLVRTDFNAAVVPAQAVLTGETGLYVYVVKPDGTVAPQAVTAGVSADGFTEILDGPPSGQSIVLDGQSRLAPGSRISVVSAPEPVRESRR